MSLSDFLLNSWYYSPTPPCILSF